MKNCCWPRLKTARALDLARRIAAMDEYATPALLRLALAGIVQTQQISPEVQAAVNRCPLGWLYYAAVVNHLPPNSNLAQAILANTVKLQPGPLKAKGQAKRILLFVMRKQRDLFVDLVLRYWLEYLGHEVHMRPIGDAAENSILELLPDVIIWGGPTTRRKVELARFARQRNILSVVRREEVAIPTKFGKSARQPSGSGGWAIGIIHRSWSWNCFSIRIAPT